MDIDITRLSNVSLLELFKNCIIDRQHHTHLSLLQESIRDADIKIIQDEILKRLTEK